MAPEAQRERAETLVGRKPRLVWPRRLTAVWRVVVMSVEVTK